MSSPLNDLLPELDVLLSSESFTANIQVDPFPECLAIIAQPCCSSKVRYRTDYLSPLKRRDPLMNKTPDSNYKGPAVYIPPIYLVPTEEYYIGVSLATIIHEKTKCQYIHPYELESIDYDERNDRSNNIVWFPIVDEDRNGIKSFPDIRIVRKTEDELESYGDLRPFHNYDSNLLNNVVPKALSQRQKVREYNLKKANLAFCIGQKKNVNDRFPTIINHHLIIFSDDMIVISDEDDKSTESAAKSNPSPPPDCRMYKYAPRRGYTEGNQEILIFYTKKLEEKKYGKLQIIFQSDTPNINWSAEVNASNIEVKDQMVSFRTPSLLSFNNPPNRVKIILQQRDRRLQSLEYFYIQKSQCETCQANATNTSNPIVRMNSNKRTKSNQSPYDDYEPDGIVPVHESTPVLQQSKSVPESNSSNSTSRSSNQTNKNEDPLYPAVRNGIELLFTNNDFKPLLRSCRLFVRQRPELLHQAIDNNYSDLVSTFVPVAGIELLHHKNQFGETVLLHAARLNHVNTIKALLERKNSDEFLEDTNNKNQNIFHILALNTDSDSILDLFIEHLLKISINIHEKFDYIDIDNHTPLQLAIKNNNLSATRHLLKYFDKNVYGTSDDIGDTLIHIAVRYTDITMLKYLLNEGQLIQQGNQSNSSMKPIELARSMKHDDMVEYFKEIYPQPEIDEDENSDSD